MTKVSELVELAETPAADDVLPIADTSATATKKVSYSNLTSGLLTTISGESFLDLSDVSGSLAPTTGQILTYQSGVWNAGDAPQGGQITATASGTIANGDTVVLNSDGTVSVVTGQTASAGTAIDFMTGQSGSDQYGLAYDPTNDKILICYRAVSGQGEAVVATVTGTTISLGTPVVFDSDTSTNQVAATYHPDSGNIVIFYEKATVPRNGKAIVATISGTTVSFGSSYNIGETGERATGIRTAIDPLTGNAVVVYVDHTATNYYPTCNVVSVAGTVLTVGTKTVVNTVAMGRLGICGDPDNNKVIIGYAATSGNKAFVGTVSGTTISFGAIATVLSGAGSSIDFMAMPSKGILATASSSTGTALVYGVVGTVTGTSISFGTSTALSASTMTQYEGSNLSYVSSIDKCVYFNKENSDTYAKFFPLDISGGLVTVGTALNHPSTETNTYVHQIVDYAGDRVVGAMKDGLGGDHSVVAAYPLTFDTSADYLGIAAEAISDTASGAIYVYPSIATNQTSLTIGTTYYVDTDGTLTTTNTGVRAGRALSTTELLVKP